MSLAELMKPVARLEALDRGIEKAFAYIRVSHEKSARKNLSPETQKEEIEKYAAEHGIEIVMWYTDLAKSGFKKESARVQFRQVIEDAQRDPEITVVLVWRYERFSRGWMAPAQQAELLEHGVRLISVTEGYYDPDTETGAIMMPLTWGLSRQQSIKLRQIVTANMKSNAVKRDPDTGWAYKNGGLPMWGYRTHRIVIGRDQDKYVDVYRAVWVLDDTVVAGKPVHEWARTVLIDWRLKEKAGYRIIADRLTRLGVPTPRGKDGWSDSTVHSLLGEFDKVYQYAGYGFWNRRNWQSGFCKDRDKAEWLVVENAHPAIITEDECDKLYSMVRLPLGKRPAPKPKSRWLLSNGALVCARCGSKFAGKQTDNDYYLCGTHIYRRGAGCGPSWYIRKDEFEEFILGKLLSRVRKGDVRQWVAQVNSELNQRWAAFERTAGERARTLADLEDRLVNLVAVAEAGGDAPELAGRIRETSDHISRLRRLENAQKPALLTADAVTGCEFRS